MYVGAINVIIIELPIFSPDPIGFGHTDKSNKTATVSYNLQEIKLNIC